MRVLKLSGYTILEVMITIVVLGAVTALAIPRYTTTIESFRSKEGVQALRAVLQAQLSADVDVAEGRIASYNLASLDVTIPVLDHFAAPILDFNGTGVPPNVLINAVNYPVYAHILRSSGAYTLFIQGTVVPGRILCRPQAICQSMKYAPW